MSNDTARFMNDLTVVTSTISLVMELADLQALMGHSEPSTSLVFARDKLIKNITCNKTSKTDGFFAYGGDRDNKNS